MSSAMNHRKRSHRSESLKAGAFNTTARTRYYRLTREYQNLSVLGLLSKLFRRKDPRKPASHADTVPEQTEE